MHQQVLYRYPSYNPTSPGIWPTAMGTTILLCSTIIMGFVVRSCKRYCKFALVLSMDVRIPAAAERISHDHDHHVMEVC